MIERLPVPFDALRVCVCACVFVPSTNPDCCNQSVHPHPACAASSCFERHRIDVNRDATMEFFEKGDIVKIMRSDVAFARSRCGRIAPSSLSGRRILTSLLKFLCVVFPVAAGAMLWFKKRLSSLFGGGKRSKRGDGASSKSGPSAPPPTGGQSTSTTTVAEPPKPAAANCAQCSRGKQCRIHTAIVSILQEHSRSVTVEWYERGESKGKEIDVDILLELNKVPLQRPGQQANNAIQQNHQQQQQQQQHHNDQIMDDEMKHEQTPAPANLSRRSSSVEDEEDNYQPEQTNATQAIIRYQNLLSQRAEAAEAASAGQSSASTNNSRSTNNGQHAKPDKLDKHSTNTNGKNAGVSSRNVNNYSGRPTMAGPRQNEQLDSRVQQKARQTISNPMAAAQASAGGAPVSSTSSSSTISTGGAAQGSGGGGGGAGANNNAVAGSIPRRSSCVTTVGMMEENRNKQRDMFKVMREKKMQLMNQDGGNPNWEFINMIRQYQATIEFRPLVDEQPTDAHQITVCVRKRPLSAKEQRQKEVDVVCVPTKDTLLVHEPKLKVDLTKYLENQKFRFDYTFDEMCSNETVYNCSARPLVQSIFEGTMATCFAYGQTGSGKTHTMGGNFHGRNQDSKSGIYALAARDIFGYLTSPKYRAYNLTLYASFFEIYSAKVYDLLSNKVKLRVLEDGRKQVQLVGLTEKEVGSVEEVLAIISKGNHVRTSGQTASNANSSRSHAIFSLTLRGQGNTKVHGKFSFIDLAGNERGSDTSSDDRRTRMESAEINKSLLALKECIRAMGSGSKYLPFRSSTLTMVLRDSFVGENIRTCMIAMIAPGMSSCEHTLNTLRYAHRLKELAVVDPSEQDAMDVEASGSGSSSRARVNDLDQLRSLNEHEMSMELYNQHTAISALQQKEEEVLDNHLRTNEQLEKIFAESKELYNISNLVDYDQDAYSKRGEELFAQLEEIANSLKNQMSEFRTELAKEEMVSQTTKNGRRHN
uniref:Kinesin-like protein n=1 Tax=Anopheles farauti TaxID=69004 RepID=A0A182QR60_9DIPT